MPVFTHRQNFKQRAGKVQARRKGRTLDLFRTGPTGHRERAQAALLSYLERNRDMDPVFGKEQGGEDAQDH